MKRKTNVSSYLWVCEKQDNGNIHYHILINRYVNWQTIRRIWNNILNKNGYIELYRQNQLSFHKNGFQIRKELIDKWSKENQRKAYEIGMKENWTNPNTTDIHKLEKIKNVANYMIKYMTKGLDDKAKKLINTLKSYGYEKKQIDMEVKVFIKSNYSHLLLECRHWNCSDNLRELDDYTTTINNWTDDEIDILKKIAWNRDKKNLFKNDYYAYINGIKIEDINKYCQFHSENFRKINEKNLEIIYYDSKKNTIFDVPTERINSSAEVQLLSDKLVNVDKKIYKHAQQSVLF